MNIRETMKYIITFAVDFFLPNVILSPLVNEITGRHWQCLRLL